MDENTLVRERLRSAGLCVDSVYDLVNRRIDYRSAIAVLVGLLGEVREPRLKEGIVRALTTRWAVGLANRAMLSEFEANEANTPIDASVKWAIGNAISEIAETNDLDTVERLIKNTKHGKARQMLAMALARIGGERAEDILLKVANDSDMTGHCIIALGRMKSRRALGVLRVLERSDNAWWRKEARSAIKEIGRSAR